MKPNITNYHDNQSILIILPRHSKSLDSLDNSILDLGRLVKILRELEPFNSWRDIRYMWWHGWE